MPLLGVKLGGSHFGDSRRLIGQLPDLYAAGFSLLQVRRSLLFACPFRLRLLQRAADIGFALVLHLDDTDDMFFLHQLDSWAPLPLNQCVVHAEVEVPTFPEQLSLLYRGAESRGLALSIENVYGCADAGAITRLLAAEPSVGFCLDVGHARRAGLFLSAELVTRVRLVHLHGTDSDGRDHCLPNEEDFEFMKSLQGMRSDLPIVLEVNQSLNELCSVGGAVCLALRAHGVV